MRKTPSIALKSSLYLFDLDQTLIDLAPSDNEWRECKKQVADFAQASGLRVESSYSPYLIYRMSLRQFGRDGATTLAISEILDNYEVAFVQSYGKATKGSGELVRLTKDGILGIVTSNGRKCLEAVFSAGRLPRSIFSVLVAREDVSDIKPSAIPIELAWQRASGVKRSLTRSWFIGDSEWDLEASKAFEQSHPGRIRFALISKNADATVRYDAPRFSNVGDFVRWVLTA